jgi:sugar O-acyltransferase (sialic acid O-acetyltransferase NeuD family)
MPGKIILVGGGGHCRSCIDVLESGAHAIYGILDYEPGIKQVLGYPVLGSDELIESLAVQDHLFLVTIGQLSNSATRVALFKKIVKAGGKLAIIISTRGYVSRHASLNDGTIIMHEALVNAGAEIGANCIINSKALVEHDAQIGQHTHIATGAKVNGDCKVGSRCFIGSGTVLIQGVRISDDVVVGAGSVVINDITESGTYAGNPARKIN